MGVLYIIVGLIVVNTLMTYMILVNLVEGLVEEMFPADIGLIALRICLIPPIGIILSALAMCCILIAWFIMIVLEIWNRDSN